MLIKKRIKGRIIIIIRDEKLFVGSSAVAIAKSMGLHGNTIAVAARKAIESENMKYSSPHYDCWVSSNFIKGASHTKRREKVDKPIEK